MGTLVRVAVSAFEPGLSGAVNQEFGRAPWFVIVDPETAEAEVVDNSDNRDALGGAGVGSTELVAEHGAHAVLTGRLGPRALQALDAASIPAYKASGMSVADAVAAFKEGKLQRLNGASGALHRGPGGAM